MAAPFPSTLAFLEADERVLPRRVIAIALLLLLTWGAWLVLSRAPVYAVSEDGRLLAAGAASPVQTPVAGLVVETRLALGAEVKARDVLVKLDSTAESLRRDEEMARLAGLDDAIDSLEKILHAERGLATATERSFESRVNSAAARARAAAEVASLTQEADTAIRRLKGASLVSGLDAIRAAEDLQRERGLVRVNRADTAQAAADFARAQKETEVRLLNLERELADLRSRSLSTRAVIAQLDWEIERRLLRAPIDGTVADVGVLKNGVAIAANEIVATVAPKAAMRWVAYFPVREIGRIRAGQTARVRLDAFPWTAYGPLRARVAAVGSEPREQRVRVEFEVLGSPSSVPLAHGMTGATDVEVDMLPPYRLLLRLAGQVVQEQSVPSPTTLPSATAPRP